MKGVLAFSICVLSVCIGTVRAVAQTGSVGTGFFVTDNGVAVTNAHVVDDCSDITVSMRGSDDRRATRIAEDRYNDLALIRIQNAPTTIPLTLNFRPQWGGTAHVFGFPLSERLSPNFTTGTVTSLSIRNNSSVLQISAPVQPGNSGGPIFDEYGTVIGVVVAKLKDAEATNFGVRSQVVDAFLHSEGINLPIPLSQSVQKLDAPKIAEIARNSSIKIHCKKNEGAAPPNLQSQLFQLICNMHNGTLKDTELKVMLDLHGRSATVAGLKLVNSNAVYRVLDETKRYIRFQTFDTRQRIRFSFDVHRDSMHIESTIVHEPLGMTPVFYSSIGSCRRAN